MAKGRKERGSEKQAPPKPKRTPAEWGTLRPEQLGDAVLMELPTMRTEIDPEGQPYQVPGEPKRVFIPKDQVEKKAARGYQVVEGSPGWQFFKPAADK